LEVEALQNVKNGHLNIQIHIDDYDKVRMSSD
jgi:hypothetical protein